MNTLPILKFVPQFKSVLWGGKRIAAYKSIPPQGDNIGESWEISGVPGHESVVSDGPLQGRDLHEVMLSHARTILGDRLFAKYGTEFPLLVKIIDSADDLSVQVHPDDDLAARRHHCPGKTEMWVCVDPMPGAYLFAGFNRTLTPDQYIERIRDNSITECLGRFETHPGDVFFLPAGRVHSIGRGNLLIEIQQTSDITYRIYDYDRRDATGHPRRLHVQESIDAVDFNDVGRSEPLSICGVPNRPETLASCPYFETSALAVDGHYDMDLSHRDSFTILIAAHGDAVLVDAAGRETDLPQGSSALVPASTPRVSIRGNCNIISSFIP